MKTYTIEKGKNKSIPGLIDPVWKRSSLQGYFNIVIGKYDLYPGDNSGWNILTGIRYFKNLKENSINVVWKYDPVKDSFCIAPLAISDNQVFSPRGFIEVKRACLHRFSIYISSENCVVLYSDKKIAVTEKFKKSPYSKLGFIKKPSFIRGKNSPEDIIIQLEKSLEKNK